MTRDKNKLADGPPSDRESDLTSASTIPSNSLYALPAASSSKLRLGLFHKKSHPPTSDSYLRPPGREHFSGARSESDHELLRPPTKSALFSAYADPSSAQSTRSLPAERTHDSTSVPPLPKHKGLFSWAHRERKKSKPPSPSSPPDPDSFNLRSFRHIGPESPHVRDRTPSPLIPPARPRPRGSSIASDSSQRISVAAFREMQARRSAAGSPDLMRLNAENPIGMIRRSTAGSPEIGRRSAAGSPEVPRPTSSLALARQTSSSSTESESQASESSDDSAGSATLRPQRQRTITQRNATSELGHRGHPSPKMVPVSGENGFTRPRASASTSALQPNTAAKRASLLAALPPAPVPRKTRVSSDDESSSSESQDSDTAPLSSLVQPKRPGSAASSASRPRMPPKPLIDISSIVTTSPPMSQTDKAPPPPEKAQERAYPPTKPTLNDRLAWLTKGSDLRSVENVPSPDQADREGERPIPPTPTRSQTQPSEMFSGPSSPANKMNGRSMSSPNAAFEAVKDLPDTTPIVPTRIHERARPPAFSVTSRPASQVSFTSSQQSDSHPPQHGVRLISPSPSTPPEGRSRQRSSTLIPNSGFDPNSGFTASPSPPTTRPGRQRASTGIPPPQAQSHSLPPLHVSPPVQSPPRRVTADANSRMPSSSPAGSTPASSASASPASASPATRTAPLKSALKSTTTQYQPSTQLPRTRTSSLAALSTPIPPAKPFAGSGLRGNSPASSTGDSSSGLTPITPADGSEPGDGRSRKEGTSTGSSVPPQRRDHKKSPSVSFDEPEKERGRANTSAREREKEVVPTAGEYQRRERRRSEAKAAIELGNVINGRGPAANDDDDHPLDGMSTRLSMLNPMMGMNPMAAINVTPPSPLTWQQPLPNMLGPSQRYMLPQNADPAFLVAHQQAMLAAKHAFQMAVAQQALAAANEEWERGSTATSAFGGFGGMGGGMVGMGGMGGMGGGMYPGFGMPGPWPQQMMFPSSAQSMYAGSVAGSELGVGLGFGGGGWGSRSAYGEPTGYGGGPAVWRNSQFGGFGQPPMPPAPRSEVGGTRQGQRPRTRTSPSDAPLPAQHARGRGHRLRVGNLSLCEHFSRRKRDTCTDLLLS
ncbi:hypothetical protein A0H81_11558 [Grifola frondosa]|uniref:Uncharacterized protein n=1 Tax=Grifola frondosa TaxID=5627 RepID=A0A1C7LUZ4_GRIFR|nr:hypothetical protein A0H81_11558 [Grifola frondosa]